MKTAFLLLLSLPCFAANRFWVGGGSSTNWNATANTNWAATSGGANNASGPASTDDVFFDANSNSSPTTVVSASRLIRSLTCTGFTGTITINAAITLTVVNTPFTLGAGMTFTLVNATTSFVKLNPTSPTIIDVTSNGVTITGGILQMQGTGSVRLQDNLTAGGFLPNSGTFEANGKDFSLSNVNAADVILASPVINMGTGTWTMRGTPWNPVGTGGAATWNSQTSTIAVTNVGAGNKLFNGEGITWNNLTITGGGAGVVIFSGSNTFNAFTINPPKSVRFTATTTNTFSSFSCTGTVGNVITIDSTSAGSAASLSKASGTVSCDYLSLKDSTATGGACWIAGANSTFVSGVTGWVQTGCATNVGPTSGSYILPGWQRIKQ